ncbi:hypothetical protein U9M48_037869 [Paspalum notatum var. saurae]|uniref:Uncharacterized protein n=1 Tax=Paspalum notatum var. saurae TaxID=547442 RepID=A0AAQ3UFZ1_PASNO
MAICFNRRYDEDSSMEIAISLASVNCLTTLQLLLADLIELLLHLLGQADVGLDLGLKSRVMSSFDHHLHLLDAGLELGKALLDAVTEIEQDKRALKLLLYHFPLLWPAAI